MVLSDDDLNALAAGWDEIWPRRSGGAEDGDSRHKRPGSPE
jgi:hypothetical protein